MEKDFEIVKVKQVQGESDIYNNIITVTEWSNGDGCEIGIYDSNGGVQNLSITYYDFDIVKKMVKKIRND